MVSLVGRRWYEHRGYKRQPLSFLYEDDIVWGATELGIVVFSAWNGIANKLERNNCAAADIR